MNIDSWKKFRADNILLIDESALETSNVTGCMKKTKKC